MDAKMPAWWYASIERCPVMGGKLKSVDDGEAKNVKGVIQTAIIDPFKPPYAFQALGGVAVIADNTWAAMQGRKKLKPDGTSAQCELQLGRLQDDSARDARKPNANADRNVGDVERNSPRTPKLTKPNTGCPIWPTPKWEPPRRLPITKTQSNGLDRDAESAGSAADGGARGRLQTGNVTANVTLLAADSGASPSPITWRNRRFYPSSSASP